MAKSARSQYLKLIDERINDTNVLMLIEWVRDMNRNPAILSFTEGPARQLAYAIEAALKLERETTSVIPPLTMRPTERCPQCGFTQYIGGDVEPWLIADVLAIADTGETPDGDGVNVPTLLWAEEWARKMRPNDQN